MMNELKAILRTTIGKIIAAVMAGLVSLLGAIQGGLLDVNQENLNPVQIEQPAEQ